MDRLKYNIIYINRNAREERLIRAPLLPETSINIAVDDVEAGDIGNDLRLLLRFSDVHLCKTGASCLSRLFELHDTSLMDLRPTIVLIDTPHDERIPEPRPRSRSASPHSRSPPNESQPELHTPDDEVYGLKLLQRIITEAHLHNLSKLVVPVSLISYSAPIDEGSDRSEPGQLQTRPCSPDLKLLRRCVDLGAAEVVASPLNNTCLTSLSMLAYRAHKEAVREQQAMLEVRRGRKLSWVGVNEEKPYAYLREAMVSGLMKGICRLGGDGADRLGSAKVSVPQEKQALIASAVGAWDFCAHDFTDDELLFAALVMFRHALNMPALERWRIPTDQLVNFLVACRAAYNTFVPYHNFRHVVDVVQATFHFLVSIGALDPYPATHDLPATDPHADSPFGSLLGPFEGLTLLITAIGHDVGHPGVNNGFLVALKAPLAQLYNDRSVLESFHCAAFSQILRRHWPNVFEDSKLRNLMISSILSTDMGVHHDYMRKLETTQAKLRDSNSTEGWDTRMIEEQKALACSLLIKCADISNVARKYETASQWMHILSDEFSRQASMETELGIPSSLLSPPKKDTVSLSKAQLGFMNFFALPLFQGVADVLPGMQYTVDELLTNKGLFESRMKPELPSKKPKAEPVALNGEISPMTCVPVPAPTVESDTPETMVMATPADVATCETAISALSLNGERPDEMDYFVRPTNHLTQPDTTLTPGTYKEVSGGTGLAPSATDFEDPIADFAASDPFNMRYRLDSFGDAKALSSSSGKQRCSETTDGGSSAPYSGDWTSQATSATTGKMPLSPSTRGTSVGSSRESMERPSCSATAATSNVPEIKVAVLEDHGGEVSRDSSRGDDDSVSSSGSIGKREGVTMLRKRPSRFRMNALNLFRRNKAGSSPHLTAAADTTI